jgi:hypothetical protein
MSFKSRTRKVDDDDKILFICEKEGSGFEKDEAASECGEKMEIELQKREALLAVTPKMLVEDEHEVPFVRMEVEIGADTTQKLLTEINEPLAGCSYPTFKADYTQQLPNNELGLLYEYSSQIQSMNKGALEDSIFGQFVEAVERAHANFLPTSGEIFPAYFRYPFKIMLKKRKTPCFRQSFKEASF